MHLDFSQEISETQSKTNTPVPRLLFIRVTASCNASCVMCNFAGNQTPHLLSVKKAHLLANELSGSSIRHVRLTGGEPLLLDEVAQIVSIFKDAGLIVSIITNGLLLENCWSDLASSGLDQVVISLDSHCSELHDKLRRTKGLFQSALTGINLIREKTPSTLIRVNTVVSKHNLKFLPDMYVMLNKLGVKQWALIPCKPIKERFSVDFEKTLNFVRERLQNKMAQFGEPCLMGKSLDIYGRNLDERIYLLEKGQTMTPQPSCNVVKWIRFLDLKTQRVFPCNCVPHRSNGDEQFGESWNRNSWGESALLSSRTWLHDNGPSHCKGCEPLNVALGEGNINLNEDLFGF